MLRRIPCSVFWFLFSGVALLLLLGSSTAHGQIFKRSKEDCLPAPCPAPEAKPPCPAPEVKPPEKPEQPPEPAAAPTVTPEQFGATGGGESFAASSPNMIGDSTSGACGTAHFAGVPIAEIDHPTFGCSQIKIGENGSPMPRDRFFFTYQSFQRSSAISVNDPGDGSIDFHKISINKYVFGLEKTFFDSMASVELRVPYANEMTNQMLLDFENGVAPAGTGGEFGNLFMAFKSRLWERENLAFSGGTSLQVPTAPNVRIRVFNQTPVALDHRLTFHNNAVILSPFIGSLMTPTERLFIQSFLQVSVPLNGARMDFDPNVNGVQRARESVNIPGQTVMQLDVSAGRWFYRNPQAGFLTGVAGILEAHWSGTLDTASVQNFTEPGFLAIISLGNGANRIDSVNLTAGPTFEFGNRSTLAVGFVAPLTTGDNRGFDWELNVQLNYRFGAQGSGTQAPPSL